MNPIEKLLYLLGGTNDVAPGPTGPFGGLGGMYSNMARKGGMMGPGSWIESLLMGEPEFMAGSPLSTAVGEGNSTGQAMSNLMYGNALSPGFTQGLPGYPPVGMAAGTASVGKKNK